MNDIIKQNVVYKTGKGTPVTDSVKVANVFGKEHKNITRTIRRLISDSSKMSSEKWFFETTYLAGNGKKEPMFIMNRDGFSLLAMGLTGKRAMQFKIGFIEQFNCMEEKLKQIQSQQGPAVPTNMVEALRLALVQAEEIEKQQKQLEEQQKQLERQAPKVLFSQSVEASKQSVLIGELAKILRQNGIETGEKRLFKWLREHDFLCSYGERRNQPTQKAVEMGLFEMKKTTITKPNGEIIVSTTTKVTGKGQIYFVNRFLYNHQKLMKA